MLSPPASIRALALHRRLPLPHPPLLPPQPPPRLGCTRSLMPFSAQPAGQEDAEAEDEEALLAAAGGAGEVSHQEWQRWGTTSPLPAAVAAVDRELLEMEAAAGEKMRFGGVGSKLKCWLPMEDCMCARLLPCNLWTGVKFWLYMHPKDFLRQNNTGKLLWQVFGIQAAQLCLFGIQEHEDIMWDAFQRSGKGKVPFLYPNKSSNPKSVSDLKFDGLSLTSDLDVMGSHDEPFNFVLLDGTWSNSAALYRRLKERWPAIWGEEDIPCISLSTLTASVMHKLRPQPAWDRTCTAAAAAGLLWELHMRPDLSAFELEKQAEAVEDSLDILLDALTARRIRLGRSITRKQRHHRNCV